MSQRRTSDTVFSGKSPDTTFTHQGRKYRKSSTTSSLTTTTPLGIMKPFKQSPHGIGNSSPIITGTPPSTTATHRLSPVLPKEGSLTRSIILPPPQPPTVNAKGRPFSAKRSIKSRPTSFPPQHTDEYRIQFAMQHSKPLPPINTTSSSSTPPSNTTRPSSLFQSPTVGGASQAAILEATDSAVDLEYYSQCGTPVDVLPSSDCSTYSPTIALRQKIGDMIINGGDSTNDKDQKLLVPLCLKLPNGERLQVNMPATATIRQVTEYAEKCAGVELTNCDISTNEIPKRTFDNHQVTLEEAGILVRTVLHFSLP